jgi:hypothetical protein
MQFSTAVLLVLLIAVIVVLRRKRRAGSATTRRSAGFRVGPGASGTMYDLLNEEKRNAIEIIVEDKAAYTEAEHADGNLPDLENPNLRKP